MNSYFVPSGKYDVNHTSDTNPCHCVLALLHGFGLPDDDTLKSFGKFMRFEIPQRIGEVLGCNFKLLIAIC